MNLSLWDSSVPFLIKGNKMAYMKYEELVDALVVTRLLVQHLIDRVYRIRIVIINPTLQILGLVVAVRQSGASRRAVSLSASSVRYRSSKPMR
jgi:hypothetical protein